jgi:SAM-dependent methyltransferase
MLEASARAIEARCGEDALVLDVGGAGRPFSRADWVLDLLPYESRGQLGWQGDPDAERFAEDTWVRRDICAREPWPFADDQFDFVVCSHTLEDVRDPVWVSSELARVAKAGYVEVPSLQEELTYGIQGPWVGWGHHHWLMLVKDGGIEFVFKHHVVNRDDSHLPAGSLDGVAVEQRVQTLWWEGAFRARERFMVTAEELDPFLAGLAAHAPPAARQSDRVPRALRRLVNR